jgi:hypothetical protein
MARDHQPDMRQSLHTGDLFNSNARPDARPLDPANAPPRRVPMPPALKRNVALRYTPHPNQSFAENLTFAARFAPAIRAIVGPCLLVPTPLSIDRSQAADFMVLTGRDVTIGARVRRNQYAATFAHEFTLCASTHNGTPSEYDKIVAGFGDWFFYGFADTHDGKPPGFVVWYLLDLHAWRAALIRRAPIKCTLKTNPHSGKQFAAFDVTTFGDDLIIASAPPAA